MELRPLPGMVRKHFTAMDMVARYSAVGVRGSATARTAKESLERVVERMPFANRGIQVDGGSEFMAEFEEACEDKRIQLFVLPPVARSSMGTWGGATGPIARSSGSATPGAWICQIADKPWPSGRRCTMR